MKLRTFAAFAFAFALLPVTTSAKEKRGFTDTFPLANCQFSSTAGNAYFMLTPGRQAHYNNAACVAAGGCDKLEELTITVLNDEKVIPLEINGIIQDVHARVVQEYETADGELVEISHNYFVSCANNGDVYYFGEDVDIYENGQVVSHDGAWLAGENGAMPGIVMPGGAFLLGSRYYQEVAPGVALDRAEHTAMNVDVSVPAGDFADCVEVTETTGLVKHDVSTKVYCPGTGLVVDDDAELMSVTP